MKLRKKHGRTQAVVAEYLGVARNTYSRYETGEREPDFETLIKLAEYFGTTVSYLIGESDDPAPHNTQKPPSDISTEEVLKIALRNMLGREPTDGESAQFLRMGKALFDVQDKQVD